MGDCIGDLEEVACPRIQRFLVQHQHLQNKLITNKIKSERLVSLPTQDFVHYQLMELGLVFTSVFNQWC